MANKAKEEAGARANEQSQAWKRYRGKLNTQKVLLRREKWKSLEPLVIDLENRIRELKSKALASVKPVTFAELVSGCNMLSCEVAFDFIAC